MGLPKVTFGIVNCNRLYYLKSCLESLLYCTEDYPNKEIIIVDNASVEDGTEEYLKEKEAQGLKVIRKEFRDPSNEFAKGLNTIVRESTGDFIFPLQGDMQFIVKGGWLREFVNFYQKNKKYVGFIMLDAQRKIRNATESFTTPVGDEFKFVYSMSRNPINGAADVMYSREIIDLIYPWNEKNKNHEGGNDSETAMLEKINKYVEDNDMQIMCTLPMFPVSVGIFTDAGGTNARVYGDYWSPKEDFRYYEIYDYDDCLKRFNDKKPLGIEDVAMPIGWDKPVDTNGNWLKNPINPSTAGTNEYVILYNEESKNIEDNVLISANDSYISEWLES